MFFNKKSLLNQKILARALNSSGKLVLRPFIRIYFCAVMAAIALVAIKFITRPNDIAGAYMYKENVKDNLLIRTYGQII